MEIISNIKACTGCAACANICLTHSIVMQENEEGFFYPHIISEHCVECGKCREVCRARIKDSHEALHTFIAYNKDDAVREESSSGGLFSAFAKKILQEGGVVFGAAFGEQFCVSHIMITEEKELSLLRKSKYVQSQVGDSYRQAKNMLEKGVLVLFSGTPCQIGGLKAYLGKEYANLYCVDVLCKGVPSHRVWLSYLESILEDIEFFCFRDKSKGWDNMTIKYTTSSQDVVEEASENLYMQVFQNKVCLRDSCYICDFKGIHDQADITIGDCWGYKNYITNPQNYNVAMGLSAMIIHSERGRKLLEDAKDNLVIIKETNYKNNAVENSSSCPEERRFFYPLLEKRGFKETAKILGPLQNSQKREVILRKLAACNGAKNDLEDALLKKSCKNIALYGIGTVGLAVYYALYQSKNISVHFYIDAVKYDELPLAYIKKEKLKRDVFDGIDAVIVTPWHSYGTIKMELRKYTDIPIYGIEELLFHWDLLAEG